MGGLQPGASPDKRLWHLRGVAPLGCEGWGKGGAVPGGYGNRPIPGPGLRVGCVWPGRGSGRSTRCVLRCPECHIEPGSSSASRKDRKRHGRQFLSSLPHATSGSCGHGRPLPVCGSADRAGDDLPGWVPRALHTLGATRETAGKPGQQLGPGPRACRGQPGRAVPRALVWDGCWDLARVFRVLSWGFTFCLVPQSRIYGAAEFLERSLYLGVGGREGQAAHWFAPRGCAGRA